MNPISRPFSLFSMIVSTLRHRRAITIAVALGVATATAVITGALLVGDSMRGSLKSLTIERLGRIESIVAPGPFFPIPTLDSEDLSPPVAVILFPGGSIETKVDVDAQDEPQRTRRIGGIQILGIDASFWELDVAGITPDVLPGDDTVVLNASAADELGVRVGDSVTLRLPVENAVPADSPLGRREIQSEGLPRMTVAAIVPDRGLGRFSLSPNQAAPRTVFASREVLADVLDRTGQANVLLFDRELADDAIPLSMDLLGWDLQRVQRGEAIDHISLTSQSLLLPEAAVDRIVAAMPDDRVTRAMTYLANAIEKIDAGQKAEEQPESHSVPYSIITAIDSGATLALDYAAAESAAQSDGEFESGEVPIVINDWAADRLAATKGTRLRVFYYEPEVEDGNEIEQSFDAVVTDIVPITKPSRPYRRGREAVFDAPVTPYNDPSLTPEVPGVTDQDSISDWDLPFPLTRKIEREDDEYWNEHRLTPKAFIPLEAGQRLFGSRFGQTTGLRFDPGFDLDELRSEILAAIQPIRADLGWSPQLIRQKQLAASRGTTPFDGLFLALSFFVIFAAMMLIALLLRLGMLQRIDEFGTLMAVGFTPRRVMSLVLGETAMTALMGVVLGLVGGVAYASGVLWALRSWWVGAVTVPFLEFHASPISIIAGGLLGWLVCMLAAGWTVRVLLRLNPAALLGGRRIAKQDLREAGGRDRGPSRGRISTGGGSSSGNGRLKWVAGLLAVTAIVVAGLGSRGAGQQAAAGFVGGGMLLLMAGLMAIYLYLGRRQQTRMTLPSLATANARRSPLRSTLTIGLIATAAFLILSITAFRMSPTDEGTGGFDLIATASTPIARDLSDPLVRQDLLGRDADLLAGATIVGCRMKSGDDASCNNLYQATRPTVLAIPDSVTADAAVLDRFGWAASASEDPSQTWALLDAAADGTADSPIPVVIDQNTAMWSLQMTGGIGQVKAFEYDAGKPIAFEVVGLLGGSVLQGKLMIGEANFKKVFPGQSGYQYYLIRTDESVAGSRESRLAVSDALESRLVDVGMDVRSAEQALAELLAVQNTYLRTFQSLGALGLLLGTIGLAVAQFRSVLERRNELAVMRAVGFTRRRLAYLVMGENFYLLVAGMGCGIAAAVLSVLPYASITGANVPIAEPLWILLGILVFGMMAGMIAVARVSTLPLLQSLRAERAAIEL